MRLLRTVGSVREEERGIALMMALGVLVVMTILSIGAYSYATSNNHAARLSAERLSARAIAESGVNNAVSILSVASNDPLSAATLPPGACNAGLSCVTCGSTQCVQTNVPGGYALWTGSLVTTDQSGATLSSPYWMISSTGFVRNPDSTTQAMKTAITKIPIGFIPPPYSFASLNAACEKHTLIIRSSGQLTVTNAMYISSCNSPQDGFDIFGPGGSISAPDIRVVGGWETHNGDAVVVNGVTCSLAHSSLPLTAAQPAGCPSTGQPLIADPFAGKLVAPALGSPACTSQVYGTAVSYSPKQNLSGALTAAATTIVSTGTAIPNGATIQIDSEQMLVTAGGGTTTLTVTRARNGTTAATHTSGKEIKNVPVSTVGTAATPGACTLKSGSVTLQPGTYYGGICIGSAVGANCGSNIGGTCTTTGTTANVTLAPGVYIMAGGGFFVCGASTLSAPHVLIYNTQDPTYTAGAGAIDQIELNTTGSVSLGPLTVPPYKGLTIFQDPALGVASAVTCDSKSSYSTPPTAASIANWDIALMSMASTGANGPLGSISGTIYSPSTHSDFADFVGGTANLAVLGACILLDGGNATFAFDPAGLFGITTQMTPVSMSG